MRQNVASGERCLMRQNVASVERSLSRDTDRTVLLFTLSFLRSTGHRANSSTATVTVAKACQVLASLDARHTEAKIDAFNDTDCDTLATDNTHPNM